MEKEILIQLVNELGQTTGYAEKHSAHRFGGVFHRAVSVVLINRNGKILLQKRAKDKYHFAGMWANACCTHPLPDESPANAAERSMLTELGVRAEVKNVGAIVYEAHDHGSGLTEKEYDHVFIGNFEGPVYPNTAEVESVIWESAKSLDARMQNSPHEFVPWLRPVLAATGCLTSL